MAERHPDRFTPEQGPRVGDPVVLQPTSRQRIGSALLKACCAFPLLLALPVATGKTQTIIIVVAVVSAVLAIVIDVLAQRDIWLKLSPTGITTRSGSIPWWAIDEISVSDHSVVETVVVRSFGTLEMTLPAPRNGPTGSNPHFPDEVRLIMGNWQRYRQVRPTDPLNLRATLDRAKSLAESAVIDLRPDDGPLVDLTPPSTPAALGGHRSPGDGRDDLGPDVHGQGPDGHAPMGHGATGHGTTGDRANGDRANGDRANGHGPDGGSRPEIPDVLRPT